jgi:polyferredoxin
MKNFIFKKIIKSDFGVKSEKIVVRRYIFPIIWILFLGISPWVNHFLALNLSTAIRFINEENATQWIFGFQLVGLFITVPAAFGAFE